MMHNSITFGAVQMVNAGPEGRPVAAGQSCHPMVALLKSLGAFSAAYLPFADARLGSIWITRPKPLI